MASEHDSPDIPAAKVKKTGADTDIQHQVLIESLTFLSRSLPSATTGHIFAALFVVVALYEVVPTQNLFIWMGVVVVISLLRNGLTLIATRRLLDAPYKKIQDWARLLATLAFVQTSTWGASVFFIWPDSIEHRAVLVTILAGIIAAGGIMLALHRRSFVIYCLPIALPAVIQLANSGTRLEVVLAILLVFYSVTLLVSVNRLTSVFLDGLRVRYLTQTESRTDALTTLANRRGFDESLRDIWQQSIRTKQSIGLLIIDVDFFKHYNDYYGHPQGDIALKKVAELLSMVASRSTDICARIGGEEFAVIMPATELEGCRQIADDIKESLANARIPHRNSDLGYLSVSIGLNVKTQERSSSVDLFVMETDQALYEAKESGRNKVCLARSISPPD